MTDAAPAHAHLWRHALPCLACPHCGEPPSLVADGVTCPRGHHFDLAREGYVNLLPGAGRRSPLLGDSRAMLLARRAFLARGHYDRIADALATRVAATLAATLAAAEDTQQQPACIVDAGCGEGFYLGHIQRHLDTTGLPNPTLIGLDVSRDAARLAARTYPRVACAVADITTRLPIHDACAEVLLSIFAPRNPAEFARILRPRGTLLVVIPTDEHLASLRAHVSLLRVEPDKREHVVARLASGFTLTATVSLRYDITLSGPDAALLVSMSPSARHLPTGALDALAARLEPITTPVSVELLAFQRHD